MNSSFNKFFSNNWVVGIGTGIILIFFTLIITDWYNKANLLKEIIKIINYPIKLWWLLAIAALIVASLRSYSNKKQSADTINPNEVNLIKYSFDKNKPTYTFGRFNSFNWHWDWLYNAYFKKYEIVDLTPNCPNKKCIHIPMKFKEKKGLMSKIYLCPNCNEYQTIYIYDGEVESYILEKNEQI